MTKQHMGGPAFPTENERQTGANSYHHEGMTLWDYYAAAALTGTVNENHTAYSDASIAAEIADAMLTERQKRMDNHD